MSLRIIVCLVVGSLMSAHRQTLASEMGRAYESANMSSKDVQRGVQEALNRNPHLLEISVSSSRGVVSLSGTVVHYQGKLDAESVAAHMPGVRIEHAVVLSLAGSTDGVLSVKDRLSVEPDLLADETTRTRVNKAIYREINSDPEISCFADIPVRASFANGTVRLMGSISDPKHRDSLLSRVRDVYGVSFVEDALVVHGQPSAIQSSLSRSMSPCGEASISRQEVAHAGH